MSERIYTPFTNEHFTAYCLKMVGQPYWYGTCGYKATTSLLSRKGKQYPSHYTSSRMSRYKQDIRDKKVVCDCIGGAKGYAWTNGGQAMLDAIGTDSAVPNKYGANGCPDKGANAMFAWVKSKGMDWGTIDTLQLRLCAHKGQRTQVEVLVQAAFHSVRRSCCRDSRTGNCAGKPFAEARHGGFRCKGTAGPADAAGLCAAQAWSGR